MVSQRQDKYIMVGELLPEGESTSTKRKFDRGWFRQGWVFKDEQAFLFHPSQPCYAPELSDKLYTADDILRLCNNQQEIAKQCFYSVDWQAPETWLDEMFNFGLLGWCERCQKLFDLEQEEEVCPDCGAEFQAYSLPTL